MLADWTDSGARTSGLTAPPGGATRTAIGGADTTSTARAQPQRDVSLTQPGCSQINRLARLLRRDVGTWHLCDSKIADGLPLSVEERSCSGHHFKGFDPFMGHATT